MKNFYYQLCSFSNSLFINNRSVEVIDAPHCLNSRQREWAKEWEQKIPNIGIGILFLERREPATPLSRQVHGGDMMMDYKVFLYTLEGEDHCRAKIKYTFIVGVSDYAGNTQSLQHKAFNRLQRLLMESGIGCLNKEEEDKFLLWKEFGPFEEAEL